MLWEAINEAIRDIWAMEKREWTTARYREEGRGTAERAPCLLLESLTNQGAVAAIGVYVSPVLYTSVG